jgi:hypothetical protein
LGVDDNIDVPRSANFADFLVVLAGLFNNSVRAFEVFTEEMLELAIYNANRNTKINKVWEQFSNDLEKIQEDNDGA